MKIYMFKIIQKGGVLLTENQIKELAKFYVHISTNGDCLFGTAFREFCNYILIMNNLLKIP